MAFLQEFHGYWAFLVIVLNLVAAVWGLLAAWRHWSLPRAFWILVIAAQVAALPQVLAGVILWLSGARPASGLQHLLYGVFIVLFILGGLFYRTRMRQRLPFLFGLISLLIFLAAARGFLTGHG